MNKTQQKKNSVKIEICDFCQKNQHYTIDTKKQQLLCEYKVKYTHKGDNKEDKTEETKIKIKIPINANCNKLNDFEVFVGNDDSKLAWTTESSEKNKKEILQYLMELKKELNTSNNKKGNKDFLNALYIMIFYYAVNEYRFYRNNEWVKNMNKGDFKQYQEIIEKTIIEKTIKEHNIASKNNEYLDDFRTNEFVNNMKEGDFKQHQEIVENTIKERETANKNDKNIVATNDKNVVLTNNKTSFQQPNPKDSDEECYDFFCCCCVRNVKNDNEIIISQKNANRQNDNDLIRTSD